MTTTQEELLVRLNAIKDLKSTNPDDDDYYLRAHKMRDALERELYSGTHGVLPLCGCGVPDETLKVVEKALTFCSLKDNEKRQEYLEEHFEVSYVTSNPLVQFLFYSLDSAELTEHDFSIGGSYLTESGKLFLELLTEYNAHFVQDS